MDFSIVQQIIVAILLYMFIGMIIGLRHIMKHVDHKYDISIVANVLNRLILYWPHHLFIMLGLTIFKFFTGKKDD